MPASKPARASNAAFRIIQTAQVWHPVHVAATKAALCVTVAVTSMTAIAILYCVCAMQDSLTFAVVIRANTRTY